MMPSFPATRSAGANLPTGRVRVMRRNRFWCSSFFFLRKVRAFPSHVSAILRPEAILGLFVSLEFAELSDPSIRKSPYVHLRKSSAATVALGLHGHERYHDIFFGKDVMNFDREDTARKFHGVFKKSDDPVVALIIARQRTVTRHMPSDRYVECLKDRRDDAFGEVVVGVTNDCGVAWDHAVLSNSGILLCPSSLERASIGNLAVSDSGSNVVRSWHVDQVAGNYGLWLVNTERGI